MTRVGVQFGSVQSLSRVQLFETPWTVARQASLSITNSWSLLKPMCINLVMPSNHLILCLPLLPPSIFPSIRVFSNESVLRIRWPKYWSFSSNISPSSEYSGLISFRMDWLDLVVAPGALRVGEDMSLWTWGLLLMDPGPFLTPIKIQTKSLLSFPIYNWNT